MHDLPLITTIALAFTAAWFFGLVTQKLKLSPIVGYLLGGIAIGPYTPGFAGDVKIAGQLAELGVILLMFGVGLHFHLGDLLAVRKVAVPGAIGQSLAATLLGWALAMAFGWPARSGLVLGMAMAVASTVVLIRVLTDHKLLDTTAGHVAVGWLIVEDVLTVVVLVLIPALGTGIGAVSTAAHAAPATAAATVPAAEAAAHAAAAAATSSGLGGLLLALGVALLKLGAMVAVVLFGGSRVIPWVLVQVAKLRSRELFTLTVLVLAIALAAGSAYAFGASMALGAFLAGMVVGQSPVSHQAAADALPLRDAFAVLFFASVGMLFNPWFVVEHPGLLLAGLGIVMLGKPLAALAIVAVIGYPARTALTVALGLAQIGEFSFILSDLGRAHGLLDDMGHNLLVAVALVSITLNPLLIKSMDRTEDVLKRRWPWLWSLLDRRARAKQEALNTEVGASLEASPKPVAVILGFGPVGRTVDALLRKGGLDTVVVDLNMETVQSLREEGRLAIYGDAYNIEVMHQALPTATHLVITLPHSVNRNPLIAAAKLINPEIKVFVRARYIGERYDLMQVGADAACYEEAEAAVALSRLVLQDREADDQTVREETRRIREELAG